MIYTNKAKKYVWLGLHALKKSGSVGRDSFFFLLRSEYIYVGIVSKNRFFIPKNSKKCPKKKILIPKKKVEGRTNFF